MKTLVIAAVAYGMNAAYCAAIGDNSLPPWDEATQEHRDRIVAGVQLHLENPEVTPEQAHERWLAAMTEAGWTYGEAKVIEAKQHPCMLPFDQLPLEQRVKDSLFRAAVHLLKDLPDEAAASDTHIAATSNIPAEAVPLRLAAVLTVEYIGRRPQYTDRVYNTGLTFTSGQKRALPENVARNLLRHPDLFKEAEPDPVEHVPAGEVAGVVTDNTQQQLDDAERQRKAADDLQRQIQDVKDQVNRMEDAEALVAFAREKYGQGLNKNWKVDTLRTKVHAMIDQFGVV